MSHTLCNMYRTLRATHFALSRAACVAHCALRFQCLRLFHVSSIRVASFLSVIIRFLQILFPNMPVPSRFETPSGGATPSSLNIS